MVLVELRGHILVHVSPWFLAVAVTIRIYKYYYTSKSHEQPVVITCVHSSDRPCCLVHIWRTFHHGEDQIYGILSRPASVVIRKSYR